MFYFIYLLQKGLQSFFFSTIYLDSQSESTFKAREDLKLQRALIINKYRPLVWML